MMSQQQQYQQQLLLQQEQQRREELERQLYYATVALEDMRRQLVDLRSAYQQQQSMLDRERQQRATLAEQVKQLRAMLVEKERQERQQVLQEQQQRASEQQRQLIERVSEEVRRFRVANDGSAAGAAAADAAADDACRDSEFSSEMAFIPSSEIPAPNKYPQVDWTAEYSMARLEDMLEVPESARNPLFYELLSFHAKRLKALRVDDECADELLKRANEELYRKVQA